MCKTSNPGSNDLLNLQLQSENTEKCERLYQRIAQLVGSSWSDSASNLGLVVGATDTEALRNARNAAGDATWILAPGVGAQGGDLEAALRAGLGASGRMLIPVSRGISRAPDPAIAAKELVELIRSVKQRIANEVCGTNNESTVSSPSDNTVMAAHQSNFLEFSLKQGVLKFGSFVLKSGRTSPYFFNAGLFDNGVALFKLGKAYASAIMTSNEL